MKRTSWFSVLFSICSPAMTISPFVGFTYGSKIKVFGTEIPHSVRAKEISAEGKSIFAHDPNGKVAEGCLLYTSRCV